MRSRRRSKLEREGPSGFTEIKSLGRTHSHICGILGYATSQRMGSYAIVMYSAQIHILGTHSPTSGMYVMYFSLSEIGRWNVML